ncbi:helix-turn-helix domain-containing protein [uncultured Metabacillus sp.]|uniref:helix-turn-helix domain-containing protein n=1 Tax=uncultured Metabacillus sp. TaxID=2860135 RepID=UPI002634AD6F|nr:helix-turn-helix domain-containing protein [uncultured Metabacillus sp.]
MEFRKHILDTVTAFTGQNNVITINVIFVDYLGDIESALMLSQILYWSDRTKSKDGYFYKSDGEWSEEIKLSKYAIRKARNKLEKLKIIETKVKKAEGNPTVHYRLNKDHFVEIFISFLRNQKNGCSKSKKPNFESEKSLTEITTETTTDIAAANNAHAGESDGVPTTDLPSGDFTQSSVGEISHTPDYEVPLLEHFIQLRAHGFDYSASDLAAVKEISAAGVSLDNAKNWLSECFSSYKPKHPRDKINSLSYCVGYILDKQYMLLNPNEGENHGKEIRKHRRGYGAPSKESKSYEQAMRELQSDRDAW